MNSCKRVPGSQHGLRWTRGLFLCLFGFMTIYWIHCPRGSSLIENMRWNMLWKMPAPVLANVAGKYFWVVRNYIDKRPNHKDVVMYIVMFQLQELHAIYEVSCTMFLYALSSWSSSVVTAIVFRISEMAWIWNVINPIYFCWWLETKTVNVDNIIWVSFHTKTALVCWSLNRNLMRNLFFAPKPIHVFCNMFWLV